MGVYNNKAVIFLLMFEHGVVSQGLKKLSYVGFAFILYTKHVTTSIENLYYFYIVQIFVAREVFRARCYLSFSPISLFDPLYATCELFRT